MANPHKYNGYVRISREFADGWMKDKSIGAESRVFMAILMLTGARENNAATVSLSKIAAATGIGDTSYLSRVTDRLAAKGRIIKISIWGHPCTYRINTDLCARGNE